MSKLTLYNDLKPELEAIPGIRHVALWRNQLERENVEQPFLRPAIFIEFLPSSFKDLLEGVQQHETTVRLHIVFESYKDEDTEILSLVQTVFQTAHRFRSGYWSKLKRIAETQNFDHPNVQDYIQDYLTVGKDDAGSIRPTETTTATEVINKDMVTTLTP